MRMIRKAAWQVDCESQSIPANRQNESLDMDARIHIGVVTVSDRAARGEYEDQGGPAVISYFKDVLASEFTPVARIIPDEVGLIKTTLIELADDRDCCLIVTTGGTGPALRDVTPDATEAVCQKLLPGFGEAMRLASLQFVPTAILSRQLAGIREHGQRGSLIINLPGKPKAIAECLDAVIAAVPYCIDLINGPKLETRPERVQAFRPKH